MKEYMIVNNQRVKKLEKEHLSEEKLKEGKIDTVENKSN